MSTIRWFASPKRALLLSCLFVPALASADLRISGVNDELARNIRGYVSLTTEACDAEPWRTRRRFRKLDGEVKRALEPYGYYSSEVTSTLEQQENCWFAKVDVVPGEPVRLRQVNVEIAGPANEDEAFIALLAANPLIPGSQLRHSDYVSLKESMQVRAAERGYFEATFQQSTIDVWPDEFAADVALHFESGPRYNFGEIRQEQAFLDPELVLAYLEFEAGIPYDSALLAKAYSDLSTSGYFRRIELVPRTNDAQDDAVPIEVLLEPADRIEYTVGAGFSTDSGARARAGFQNRRLNSAGHRLKIDAVVSPVIQGVAAEYRKPLTDPRSEWMSYTASADLEDTDTYESDSFRIGLRRTKKLRSDWLRTLSLDAQYDRYDVADVSSTSNLLLPGISFDRKRSDRQIFPSRGYRIGLELRGAAEGVGSDTSFLQASAWIRWVRSVANNGRILARANIGATAQADFNELPPSVRFFAGGDESVRGFGYEELGPEDDEGNVVGGSNLAVASIEYEHRLKGNYFGAVFIDAGNAFDGFDIDPAVGAGFGIKWLSPVGPLRFYLAHPFNQSDRSVRLHIRLGPDL